MIGGNVLICYLGGTLKGGIALDIPLRSQVELFLQNFFQLNEGNKVDYTEVNRKTRLFLQEYGLTYSWMKNYIIDNISFENYYEGPSPHHRHPESSVMIFGVDWEGIQIYVKICIFSVSVKNVKAGYMSFHPSERPMTVFPLLENKE